MSEPDRTESVSPDAPAPVPIRVLEPGTCLGRRYEIRRVLGAGGYAVVYLAYDRELRREVALKILRADRMSPGALARLRREAAIARDAASPRLVRVFDIGVSEAAVFLTLEVVEGESLRERLARGPLPIAEAVRLAAQILEGLRALHSLGIVHRDVKPGNVLLERDGGVKLADFGLALRIERAETRLTVGEGVLGTLDYVSPEQALGEEVDPPATSTPSASSSTRCSPASCPTRAAPRSGPCSAACASGRPTSAGCGRRCRPGWPPWSRACWRKNAPAATPWPAPRSPISPRKACPAPAAGAGVRSAGSLRPCCCWRWRERPGPCGAGRGSRISSANRVAGSRPWTRRAGRCGRSRASI